MLGRIVEESLWAGPGLVQDGTGAWAEQNFYVYTCSLFTLCIYRECVYTLYQLRYMRNDTNGRNRSSESNR